MLWTASKIKGYTVVASDGDVGKVSDLLFDDASWHIRWLVVETGNWLAGRKVLLPSSALGHADSVRHEFSAKLTMQQVKDSPSIDTDLPVSRQIETGIYGHYGWSPYWGNGLFMGPYGYSGGMGGSPFLGAGLGERRKEDEAIEAQRQREDPNLRSVAEVGGYHIRATDGEIGHVEEMLVEEVDWSIHYLVVNTRNWWPGKKVLIAPRSARYVNWTDRTVDIDVDRQTVKNSPEYDTSMTIDRTYEDHFDTYYGGIKPVTQADRPPAGA